MKKLIYAIAFGLAFVSVTSANRVIASSPADSWTTGNSDLTRQINLVSQNVQPSHDPSVPASLTKTALPVATETADSTCKGDAVRATPPIPNHPTHIRNVVWRNVRAMCLNQITQKTDSSQPAGQH